MCRFYGFIANEPTKVECTLVYAQNALLSQSRRDLRGETHPDGWGIACYEDHRPEVERRVAAAYADLHFGVTAERLYARAVVAHIRAATVGKLSIANTHPFTCGRWAFAHNGTVRAFEDVGPRLERETEPELLRERRGTGDSEAAFLWLLSHLVRGGLELEGDEPDSARLAVGLQEAVRTLDGYCVEARADRPARLNFLLTDGRVLVASRWRNSLYWVGREGIRDCEICGIPHVHHAPRVDYRALILASEPISDEPWSEVPEGGVIAVDADLRWQVHAG